MRATNNHPYWPSYLAKKARFNPVFIIIAALFLFCLPLNQIGVEFSGVRNPSIAFSFLMAVAMICLGLFHIARLEQISLTTTTYWLALSTGLSLVPSFYLHAELSSAIWNAGEIIFAFMLFFTLQQFSFCYIQRQYLLWFPMISGWLIALLMALLSSDFMNVPEFETLVFLPGINGIILLSSLILSAYIIARTHIYKRTLTLIHITLLLTPLVTITALMALQKPMMFILTLALFIMPQFFLFRFAQKIHHALWNVSAILGFVLAFKIGWLPSAATLYTHFSSDEISIIKETLSLIKSVQFQGLGIGMLEIKQLLFGLSKENPQPIVDLYPSWLLARVAEGGVATWASLGIFGGLIISRVNNAPNGTRLMLLAILLPILFGFFFTPFIELNPVLMLFLVIQLYWIDNLSSKYHRFHLFRRNGLNPLATAIFIFSSLLVFTSVYLGGQAQYTETFNNKKLEQYQYHPWWSSFYEKELEKRAFIQSIEKNDTKAQEAYLRKQMQALRKKADPTQYRLLIEAAKRTDHPLITKQISIEASLLFPKSFPSPSTKEKP